ncbi:MAG: nucleoside triphosphate pyrophosphohydrolase [Anaerolineae bacterium]
MAITILGLGPGNPAYLTREAWELLGETKEVYVRTRHHPVIAALPTHLVLHSFDELYELADNVAEVYETIAERIVALGQRPQGVVYAVPGHPFAGESSVQQILARARTSGLAVRLVEGLSFIEPTLTALEIDALAGLQVVDATDLATAHHPPLDPDRPALIGQLDNQQLASDVKLTLMNAYPDDHLVTLVQAAGIPECTRITIPLYELDRGQRLDHLTTLYVPPLPHVSGLPAFQETVARLRAPDGCPWDREQTHQTLRSNLLEETYEVLTALDADDPDKLCEELGDLLMQIAMHVQIATEEGTFRFADVIGRIDAKLKRRHPHVFGDLTVQDSAEVLRNWEAIKADERAAEKKVPCSRLEGISSALPALARAQAIGERAARSGFDWPDVEGVLDKVIEEVHELRGTEDPAAREQEMGDLLFTLVNLARWLNVDAESALRRACDRFTQRFAEMEREACSQDSDFAALSPAEQEALWQKAKAQQRDNS